MTELPNWSDEHLLSPGTYLRHVFWYSTEKSQIDVPCSGWQHAIVWFTKGSHIFCPYTETHYSLPLNHFFVFESKEPTATTERMFSFLQNKFSSRLFGLPRQIVKIIAPDTLAPEIIPVNIVPEEFKLVKRESKRGRFLQTVLNGQVYIPSLVETLGMSRNNVLSYFYQMQKVNGIDYYLNKELDTVALHMPPHEVWA